MRRCSDIGFGGNIDNCATCGYDGACNTGVGCGDKFACAARAIRDLGVGGTGGWGSRRWTNSVQPPTVVSTDTRSGAYHWAENDYSFIHLQDSPHFNLTNRDGSSLTAYCYNCEGGICHDYNSQSPITNGWLAGQLSAAAGAGRKVVLFMHQLYYNIAIWTDPQFMGLLTNNNVVAIFTGHTHDPEWMGTSATNTAGGYLPGGTTIPVFNSGAVWHNSFLQVRDLAYGRGTAPIYGLYVNYVCTVWTGS